MYFNDELSKSLKYIVANTTHAVACPALLGTSQALECTTASSIAPGQSKEVSATGLDENPRKQVLGPWSVQGRLWKLQHFVGMGPRLRSLDPKVRSTSCDSVIFSL
jgi:hypothetical protein